MYSPLGDDGMHKTVEPAAAEKERSDAREPQAPQSSLFPSLPAGMIQRKLERRMLQRKNAQMAAGNGVAAAASVHQAAEQGIQGGGGSLPYMDQIQQSFGSHDVSAVQAHVGGPATAATAAMGATAYATGNHVAFGASPDLHTAAHEAAHVVQQQAGVHLKDGVGSVGDAYEQHADAVADRVVQGRSAQDLLDGMVGQKAGPAMAGHVQQKALQFKKKAVTGKAMGRLGQAKAAIEHAKQIFAFGAGNQAEALKASNFNSYFRMKAMRDPSCWELAASVRATAAANPEALTAAKAELAHGGNCGEHAQVAFDYLRVHAVGQTINRSAVEGLDHAFIIMGDISSEADGDLVVSDPWPTAATATIWKDHFAYDEDHAKIKVSHSMVADGQDAKSVIAAGLKLSAKGAQMIQSKYSEKDTDDQLDKGTQGDHPWIWGQADAAAEGKKYDYYQKKP